MQIFGLEMLLQQRSVILKLVHANLNLFIVFNWNQTAVKY